MSKAEREIEVKFLVRDLAGVASRLQTLGARLSTPRVQETNLRFDTPDGELQRKRHVLRLRQDVASVLTFKGPAAAGEAVSSRQEIEFQVSNFEAARHFLEALGYVVAIIYEKYRTTYDYKDCMVTLDEMPFGPFMEIEGPDEGTIRSVAADLGLDWEARCTLSYLALFDHLHQTIHLGARNLTFDELKGVTVMPQDLGLRYADH